MTCLFTCLLVIYRFASHSSHGCITFGVLFFCYLVLVVFVPYMVVFWLCSGHLFSAYFVCNIVIIIIIYITFDPVVNTSSPSLALVLIH